MSKIMVVDVDRCGPPHATGDEFVCMVVIHRMVFEHMKGNRKEFEKVVDDRLECAKLFMMNEYAKFHGEKSSESHREKTD